MNPSRYRSFSIKSVIISRAVWLGLVFSFSLVSFLLMKSSLKNYRKPAFIPEDKKVDTVSKNKESVSNSVAKKVLKNKGPVTTSKKSECKLPDILSLTFFSCVVPYKTSELIKSASEKIPSNIDLNKKATKNNVDKYHKAGMISLGRALVIQSFIETGKWPDTVSFKKPDPGKASHDYFANLKEANLWFSRVRPHPGFSNWSESLYFNAWTFDLRGKHESVHKFLSIPARTRSKSMGARLSRFSLALYMSCRGKSRLEPSIHAEFKNYSTFINFCNSVYDYLRDRRQSASKIAFEINRFHTINRKVFISLSYKLISLCNTDSNFQSCVENIVKYGKNPLVRKDILAIAATFVEKQSKSIRIQLKQSLCSLMRYTK
ncbi:MAG: hypothetical protein JXR95_08225 [Deltaproteobacteria bacterium]|nr:hypothetical protein [Deltaproteobacteria bacterium]